MLHNLVSTLILLILLFIVYRVVQKKNRNTLSKTVLFNLLILCIISLLFLIGHSTWLRQTQIKKLVNHSRNLNNQIEDLSFKNSNIPRGLIHVSEKKSHDKKSYYEIFFKENTYYIFEVNKSYTPFLWLPTYSISSISLVQDRPSLDDYFLSTVVQKKYSEIIQNGDISFDNLSIEIVIKMKQFISIEKAQDLMSSLLTETALVAKQPTEQYFLPYQINFSFMYQGDVIYTSKKSINEKNIAL